MSVFKWFLLLIVVGILIGLFILFPRLTKKAPLQEITTTETLQTELSPVANFSKIGSIINKETGLTLLYAEPGQLALTVILKFTPESLCSTGNGQIQCEKAVFQEDKVYSITGVKNANELNVIKIEEFKE